ncbi:MAG: ABC transporter permease [Lactobacillus sp.]|nr:ABC transporter permease [Lactobacillus sp.]
MKKIGLVIRETWIRQVKSVSFYVMLIAPILAMAFNLFISNSSSMQFGGMNSAKNHESLSIAYVVKDEKIPYQGVVDNTDLATAKKKLKQGKLDNYAVISLSGSQIKANIYGTATSAKDDQKIETKLAILQKRVSIIASKITPAQLKTLNTTPKVVKHYAADSNKKLAKIISSIAITIILYFFMITYSSIISQEIVSEKGTKIMEVILSSIKGGDYFLGKIFGMAMVMLTHFAIYFAIGFVAFKFHKLDSLLAKGSIGYETLKNFDFRVVLFVAMGIYFFMLLSALAGSLVSKIEDASKASGPVVILILITFAISMSNLGSAPSLILKVMSFVPFFSPILAPSFMMGGYLSALESLGSMFLLLLADVLLTYLMVKIYPKLMLQTDSVNPFKAISSAIKN